MRKLPLALALLFALGCGGGEPDAADLAAPDDLATPDLSFQPRLPTMTNHGGPVLASMELWIAVYPGDETLGAELNAFYRDLFGGANTAYWSGTLSQYGVGPATAMGVVVLPGAKPATLAHDAIPGLLAQAAQTAGGANANTVMALLVPSATTLTGVPANEIAYHNEMPVTNQPYMVLQQKDGGQGSAFQNLTFFATHEAAEVAIDPHLGTAPAWYDDDLGPQFGEVADECNPLSALMFAYADGGAPMMGEYVVARLYNDQAAAGGKVDPCWIYPRGAPYFNVAADPRVLQAGAGQTVAATLYPFSYGDVGVIDWEVDGAPAGVTITPQSGSTPVGQSIPITIALPSPAPAGDFPLAVFSTSEKTMFQSVYFLRVQVQ